MITSQKYDYLLGGKDNFAADRAAGDEALEAFPGLISSVHANRAFLNDPMVLAHARALLGSGPRGATDYIDADLRDTGKILQTAGRTIDFTRPVAVMLIAVLHLIRDEDNPRQIIAELMAAGEFAVDLPHPQRHAHGPDVRHERPPQPAARPAEHLCFDGLELVEPGVTPIQPWRPGSPRRRPRSPRCGAASRSSRNAVAVRLGQGQPGSATATCTCSVLAAPGPGDHRVPRWGQPDGAGPGGEVPLPSGCLVRPGAPGAARRFTDFDGRQPTAYPIVW